MYKYKTQEKGSSLLDQSKDIVISEPSQEYRSNGRKTKNSLKENSQKDKDNKNVISSEKSYNNK